MPPKKKKVAPVVVGTVSTRSTRRESIVNIEIIRKMNKPVKTPIKKSIKDGPKTPDNILSKENVNSSQKTSPEILEILKDWSDDETSNEQLSIDKLNQSNTSSTVLSGDQQSLIDILEGNQVESSHTNISPNGNCTGSKIVLNNQIVNIDNLIETEVIEECVVEDDSIILELSADQIKSEKQKTSVMLHKNENKIEYIYSDENKSGASDIVQSFITVKDDISDNSTNFEIISDIVTSEGSVKEDIILRRSKSKNLKCESKLDNKVNVENKQIVENEVNKVQIDNDMDNIITSESVEVIAETEVISEVDTTVPDTGSPAHKTIVELTEEKVCSDVQVESEIITQKIEDIEKNKENKTIEMSKNCQVVDSICEKVIELMKINKNADSTADFISDSLGKTMQNMQIEDNTDKSDQILNENEVCDENVTRKKIESRLPKSKSKRFSDIKPTRKSTRNRNTVTETNIENQSVELKPKQKKIVAKKEERQSETPNENDENSVQIIDESSLNDQKCEETPDKKIKTPKKRTCKKQQIDAILNDKLNDMFNSDETKIENIPTTEKIKTKAALKRMPDTTMEIDLQTKSSPNSASNSIMTKEVDLFANEIDKHIEKPSKTKKVQKKLPPVKDMKTKQCKENKKKNGKPRKDQKSELSEEVRRSDRIKTIVPVKKRSHGLVRSKSESILSYEADGSDTNSVHSEQEKVTSPQAQKKDKPKAKSKSAENISLSNSNSPQSENYPPIPKADGVKADKSGQAEIEARLKSFVHLKENNYKTDRQICKEAQEMVCDCFLAEEDIQKNEFGCGEDCLNRLLLIECGRLCQVNERCTNKRFQRGQFAPVEVFKTEKKGLGLRAAANIPYGEFILEYVGEVLDPDEFDKRAEGYSKDKNIHFYFMSLRADAIIDATMKGNISRFINHSCDPNAETQKWTVNGELRIGFFSTRTILAGEEITFDYRFQRYGKEAQKCYCEAATCRGWLGERPDESEEEEEDDEEEEIVKTDTNEKSKAAVSIPNDIELPEDITQLTKENQNKTETTTEKTDVSETPHIIPKKTTKRKPRKDILYEDFDQLNEDIEMLVTTGLKNQAHTLKLSRLMVRAKDLEQRKKLLRVLRRGELPCRRLFLDYHGLRLMHGYMIDAQQLSRSEDRSSSIESDLLQTKLELLQTLAVLPIQNKTILIESKVLPAVEKWAKNENLIEGEETEIIDYKLSSKDVVPSNNEKIEEIKFLASKLLEEWRNLKESFRIPKKQRIEQMKEHEKEANRKFMASTYAQEQETSRKNDQRYRTWSRYKSEREINKKGSKPEDKDKPSAAFLKISRHERRKLFALQMELKEEERRLKQREMWRQHEMNCMLIGADPRFTAPFDPNKGFQYIWNPSIGQWQALPVPTLQSQQVYNSPVTSQGIGGFNMTPSHKSNYLNHYQTPGMNVQNIPAATTQYPAPMIPGLNPPVSAIPPTVPVITQPPLPALPIYQEGTKDEDPSKVKFAGPIPPPVKLPPKWKCAKDKYGRPYYYHIKNRKSQWEPPPLSESLEELSDSSTSASSSTTSSDSSSDTDTDDDVDDAKLLMEVRKQMDKTTKLKSVIPDRLKRDGKDSVTPSPEMKLESDNDDAPDDRKREIEEEPTSIDIRLKEQFNLDDGDMPKKRKRVGLCEEIIISPRTEEDRLKSREDMKRYKATKEKLKRQKEQMLYQAKKKAKLSLNEEEMKKIKEKRNHRTTVKSRIKEMNDWNNEHAKKIKEVFRSSMATTVVSVLNAYRKPDCKEGRITNTEDFKHLARKLTHFVMLKEMKHIDKIEDLECTDNVKSKAREYIRKYMSKFGEVYQKRQDEPDFKD
ncbi:hypothetical protein GWI33_020325 [Rhynchophorus ferrugineus]|uniref:[histone H3]-lysine(36) N-trimethyltransferase n=1 Tax=Rhynchophorus ferrugineus TaxID=354439 RepID=A0A834M5X2_RHYFE|nr:hypothetical protein GWI33_020325 [Rhynchophorus ferrugineus]